MILPIAACLLMALSLGWFGLHVLQREVIFVDLALAQVAALGATYAVYLGHGPDEPIAYALALVFTAAGAVIFAWVRHFDDRVPQESLIGIAYVVCAASAAVLMDFAADPHGAEKLQHLLVGNVVWIRPGEVATIAAVCALVGALHLAFRRPLLAVSFQPEEAAASGMRVWLWDLVFYLTFGMLITSLVHVAGVLLIFSYLIIPAVVARLLVSGILPRLGVAYAVAVPVSVVGVASSYDHAAGPIIVVLLGAVLVVCLVIVGVRRSPSPGATLGGGFAGVGAVALLLYGFAQVDSAHEHEALHDHVALAVHDDLPTDADPVAREQWYRAHLARSDALRAALGREDDLSLRLLLGAALVRIGDPAGLHALAEIAASEVPFLRMEADDRLRRIAGPAAPSGDPLAGPVDWSQWTPPEGWQEAGGAVALP